MEPLAQGYDVFVVERIQTDFDAAKASIHNANNSSKNINGYPGYLPQYGSFPSPSNTFAIKRELSPSPSDTSMPGGSASADVAMQESATSSQMPSHQGHSFSTDVNLMPDMPPRHRGHRRAHSEVAFRLPDDIAFEHGETALFETLTVSDEASNDLFSMYINVDQLNSHSETSAATHGFKPASDSNSLLPPQPHHMRSLSMDGVFADLDISSGVAAIPANPGHQHSNSMDGTAPVKQEYPTPESIEAKKVMASNKLAELASVDPKRAKRILANRQSAARSKERKTRYILELERKVQTLQTEATTLSAQLTMLQRDTIGLTTENNELKLRLQSIEQQAQLCDALNDALREEVQRLKLVTGQLNGGNGQMMAPLKQLQQAQSACTNQLLGQQASFQGNMFGGMSTGSGIMSEGLPVTGTGSSSF